MPGIIEWMPLPPEAPLSLVVPPTSVTVNGLAHDVRYERYVRRTDTAAVAMATLISKVPPHAEHRVVVKVQPPVCLPALRLQEKLCKNCPTIATVLALEPREGAGDVVMLEKRADGTASARAPLPPSEARAMLRDVAMALRDIHAEGYVHGDIKPSNILFEARSGRFLVCDFGSCIRDGTREAAHSYGTVPYIAPEVAQGEWPSKQSDVWSMGITAAVMALRGSPWVGATGTSDSVMVHTLRHHPTSLELRLEELKASAGEFYATCVASCLNLDPALRPTSDDIYNTLSGH